MFLRYHRVEHLSVDRGAVPERVDYHDTDVCGALCVEETPPEVMRMALELNAFLHQIARRFKTPAEVRRADVVIAFELFKPDYTYATTEFFVLAVNLFQHGRCSAEEQLLRCEPVGGHGGNRANCYEGLDLQLSRLPFVEPAVRPRRPYCLNSHGLFEQYSDDELASYLLATRLEDYASRIEATHVEVSSQSFMLRFPTVVGYCPRHYVLICYLCQLYL